jgi:hypothetical protein
MGRALEVDFQLIRIHQPELSSLFMPEAIAGGEEYAGLSVVGALAQES